IGIKEEDRDPFRFLFNVNNKEEHLRFARVPFGAEASPFLLGATLQYHYDQQPIEFRETVETLRENTLLLLFLDRPIHEDRWPNQPRLNTNKDTDTDTDTEHKPMKENIFYTHESEDCQPDEWEVLLTKSSYWRILRVTAWALRFCNNSLAKRQGAVSKSGPLSTEELQNAKRCWIQRAQRDTPIDLQAPGWELIKDQGILKCKGRVQGHSPTYIQGGLLAEKRINHMHQETMHLGVASTMAAIREEWYIPKLRCKVKGIINKCPICKLYSTKPYGPTATSAMPTFRTEIGRPFETTGVDFAGPLQYKIGTKKDSGKAYILIFTCATTRAVHLEMTKSQTVEEFQRKLNAFITRKTRPRLLISDNAATFKATQSWIRKIRKSESLQDHLARQDIRWQFNLAKSPWWGGMYERLIRDIKKTLYKTLGRTSHGFEQLESIVMDIEKHLNNRPLTYVESEEAADEKVLTPNIMMWGQNAHPVEDIETDEEEVTKVNKRLRESKEHAWLRWKNEYVHSLMESHRVNRTVSPCPEIGEVVLLGTSALLIGEMGMWKKGKVVKHVRGRDGIVRGVQLLHKNHYIGRPLTLVCPLEIR
ncbi:hypothetical protein QZH41_017268, partial [Actinostola sp. cb2023]